MLRNIKYKRKKADSLNILLIGNGFDLAHELPTKYTTFLTVCDIISGIYTNKPNTYLIRKLSLIENYKDMYELLKKLIEARDIPDDKIDSSDNKISELYENINGNFWFAYFVRNNPPKRDYWIDFETEISNVIQKLDAVYRGFGCENTLSDEVTQLKSVWLRCKDKSSFKDKVDFDQLICDLKEDLRRLIRAFEIYLVIFVEHIELSKKQTLPVIKDINPDYVLSFNYTHTYQKMYDHLSEKIIKYDYIHGEACIDNNLDTDNMVLGIGEYLSEEEKDTRLEFLEFKKYFQRIFKKTGNKYLGWINQIHQANDKYKNQYSIYENKYQALTNKRTSLAEYTQIGIRPEKPPFQLYIFGHSLDVTDGDIIKQFLDIENLTTTIFYLDQKDMKEKIRNLITIIGQDKLIAKTGNKSIVFREISN